MNRTENFIQNAAKAFISLRSDLGIEFIIECLMEAFPRAAMIKKEKSSWEGYKSLQSKILKLGVEENFFNARNPALRQRESMAHNIDSKFSAIDARFDAFEKSVNARFDAVDARFDALEKGTNARFVALENSIASIRWWNMTAIGFVGLLFVFLRFFPG